MTVVRAKRCPTCGCCNCEVIPETSEPTAADITIISGTWSEPGIPKGTTSSNAVLLHNTAMPVGMATLYAEFLVGTSNQDQLRLIILRQDASNYWYAQVAPNITIRDMLWLTA